MDWLLVASVVLGAAALLVGLALALGRLRRAAARRYAVRTLPPLVIPAREPALPTSPSRRALAGARGAWSDPQVPDHLLADVAVATALRAPAADTADPWSENGDGARDDGPTPRVPPRPMQVTGVEAGSAVEHAAEAERTVRLQRPMEETLQFLPGRLEVTEGEDRGQTIRFVRHFGEVPAVTFGRSGGPPHRHVQLRSLTVSRLQARMRYEARRWELTNLSETNPTIVNGEELSVHATRVLEHGDRVEMGEVVFRFWEY